MRVNRLMLWGLFALMLAVGILGANGYFAYLAQPHENLSRQNPRPKKDIPRWPIIAESPADSEPAQESETWSMPSGTDLHDLAESPARGFFPHHAEAIEMAQGDGPDWKPTANGNRIAQAEPAPLPVPAEAEPLAQPSGNALLEELIQQELPQATAEERRVWQEELRGLNPEMVRDILRMRKHVMTRPRRPQIGAHPQAEDDWVEEWDTDDSHDLVPLPMDDLPTDPHAVAQRLEPSLAALEQARDVILNNLANAHTVGFKRSRIVLEPLPYPTVRETDSPEDTTPAAPDVTVGLGVTLAGTPLDDAQGPLKKTQQPLDVAVEGPGFFQIKAGGEMLYSRCGSWSLNPQGLLCLSSGGKLLPIQPRLKVPAETTSLVIGEDGRVTALRPGEDGEPASEDIGQIQLARFRNPAALKPQGGHVFAATPAAGKPQLGAPQERGLGMLRQGMLELSNVSREEELEEFQALQTQLQLLKHLAGSSAGHAAGSVARQKPERTRRASVQTVPLTRRLKSFQAWRDRGSSLIDEYLHSERVKAIKRSLGLD